GRGMRGATRRRLAPPTGTGRKGGEPRGIPFYGSSFIAGPTGDLVAQADRDSEAVLTASFDLDRIAAQRASWGIFRDRRPELYGPLLTLDGETPVRR
ncbi:N-carbamoylputrescine amidase, partial [Azospirillum brasilense]|nr:N-carbamoylputrescine amidase [Azospirillum brasilense]